MKLKVILLIPFLLATYSSFSQSVHYWYQDGIVVFQLKTTTTFAIPSKDKQVDFKSIDFLATIQNQFGIYQVTQLHPNDRDLLLRKTYQIEFSEIDLVEDLIAEISKNQVIEYAEKKELHRHFLTPNDLGGNATNTSGTSPTTNQWHLWTMSAQQAWDLSTGSSSVVVAVTDDAILTTHLELTNKVLTGYDAPTGGTSTLPCGTNDGNHGTHVSGTVGAQTNNGTGVASIGYNVSILPVKIGNCSGSLTHGYEGINWAANNGADVINMSWGGGGSSTYGQNVCNAAFNAGAILVAAAGNDGTNQQFYPAAFNNVISVASTTPNDAKSSFSQYGTWIDVSAPGSNIRSTYASSLYGRISGTSMASPNVAGLVGLMKSYVPTASNQQIISCLLSSATNINAANGSFIGQLGSGRINAFAALQCLGAFNLQTDAGITLINSPGTTVCGTSFTPQVTLRNFGTNALTSVTINYQWNGTPQTFAWTGNLASSQNVVVSLPVQSAVAGSYTFTASTTNPNGTTDQNLTNNQSTLAFVLDPNGQTVNLTIANDCYGNEITWNITNSSNLVVASGGPYANVAGGQTNLLSFCLPTGCYTFTINDSYGDGLNGAQWTCGLNGNYFMTNAGGTNLFQMTAPNANFGFTTFHNFCITAPTNINDAAITAIISPTGTVCQATVTPQVTISNFGVSTLTQATITYSAGGAPQTYSWSGSLTTGQNATVTLPAIPVASGNVSLIASTSLPNGQTDNNPSNNQNQVSLTVYTSGLSLPFVETFENNPFTNGTWTISNPDNQYTWEIATVAGTTPGTNAAKMNFFQYAQSARRDGMISPRLNLNGYSSATMTFEHAYRRFNQTTSDSLIVYVSTNCGATFTRIFERGESGQGTFATATTSNQGFTPANANEWCMGTVGSDCYTIDLTQFVNQNVLIKFEGFNSGTIGNNLYIDNINITGVLNQSAPTPSFSVSNTSVCTGQTVTYDDLSSANITGWNWSFPGGSPATSIIENPVITYPAVGVYPVTLEVTNAFGSSSTTSANYITVITTPTVSASATVNAICAGQTVNLSANGASSYLWSPSGSLNSSNLPNVVGTPTQTTTYTVTGSNACGSSAANVIVTVSANPLIPVISQVGTSLSITLAAGETAQWFLNGSPISGANGATLTANSPGNYTVTVTNVAGCSRTSLVVQVGDFTSLNELSVLQQFVLFPNPSSGEFTIQWLGTDDEITIEIVDMVGRKIFITTANGSDNSMIISDQKLSSGVYLVQLKQNNKQVSKRITIRQ